MLLTYPARYLYTSYVLWVLIQLLGLQRSFQLHRYYMCSTMGLLRTVFSQVLVATRDRLIYVRLRDTNRFRFSVDPLEPSPYPLNRRHGS